MNGEHALRVNGQVNTTELDGQNGRLLLLPMLAASPCSGLFLSKVVPQHGSSSEREACLGWRRWGGISLEIPPGG